MADLPDIPESYIVSALNDMLSIVGGFYLYTECPTGIINNMSVGCSPDMSFSGTYGNTSTDGYYATYQGNIYNVVNILDFNIENLVPVVSETNTTKVYSGTFECNYSSDPSFSGEVGGACEVYIPSSEYFPSSWTEALMIGMSSGITGNFQGAKIKGNIQYTLSTLLPDYASVIGGREIEYPLEGPVYLYGILFTELTITYSGLAVSLEAFLGLTIIVSQSTVNQLIDLFFTDFTNTINLELINRAIVFT